MDVENDDYSCTQNTPLHLLPSATVHLPYLFLRVRSHRSLAARWSVGRQQRDQLEEYGIPSATVPTKFRTGAASRKASVSRSHHKSQSQSSLGNEADQPN